jgi:hypothetical protein
MTEKRKEVKKKEEINKKTRKVNKTEQERTRFQPKW